MSEPFRVRGVIPPILTPLSRGGTRLDEGALRAHAAWLIEKGVHGLMPCGTTGEGPLLTTRERRRVVEVVVEAAGGRLPVIAHVGAITTRETVSLARHARDHGATAISVVTPYYYRVPDSVLVEHFCAVASATRDFPVFLYSIPECARNAVNRSVAKAVTDRCPNVIGIKDSSGDRKTLVSFVGLCDGRFQVVCGSDKLLLQALEAGACASVSGNANVFPEVVVEIFRAHWAGDRNGAQRAQERLDEVRRLLAVPENLSIFKRVLTLRGLHGGDMRLPLPNAPEETIAAVAQLLRRANLLTG